MIITIDGQAHTGKSTAAAKLAARHGCFLMNTGAMYRTVAHKLVAHGVPVVTDGREPPRDLLLKLIGDDVFELDGDCVILNGELVDHDAIFTEAAGKAASIVGEYLEVRLKLQAEQRRIAALHDRVIAEGRDQGSYVFPEATCKFYLSAAVTVQARRYALKKQLQSDEGSPEFAALVLEFVQRNARDESRKHHPLKVPAGAVVVATDDLTPDDVLARLTEAVEPCLSRTG